MIRGYIIRVASPPFESVKAWVRCVEDGHLECLPLSEIDALTWEQFQQEQNMPRPIPMSKVLVPFFTADEKQRLVDMRQPFSITSIRFSSDGQFGSRWECTCAGIIDADGETVERLLSLSSNVVRDRWFNAIHWQEISEDNALEPCVLERRHLENRAANMSDPWDIVDPSQA